jgi:5-(aminomethyl)-3-furanmethanol phosphate kinase
MRPFIRVIKVGGSLLDWSRLPGAVEAWLRSQPSAVNVLIAGAGPFTEAIWQASRTLTLSEVDAHWLCIDAMSLTSQLLVKVVKHAELVTEFAELRRRAEHSLSCRFIFDSNEFLRDHESRLTGSVLARDWTVSSDSIAARLAEVLAADELVLLKSSDPPTGEHRSLADQGYVDQFFPAFANCRFRCNFVNLRGLLLSDGIALSTPQQLCANTTS